MARPTLAILALISALAVPAAVSERRAPAPPPPAPAVWTPPPWSPPGFALLDQLLQQGHVYRSMGWT